MLSAQPSRRPAQAELTAKFMVLYDQGMTDAEAARELGGYDRSYIQQLRQKLNLPAKWGKAIQRFTSEVDATITRLRDEEGKMWKEIGPAVGMSAREVSERYTTLEQRRKDAEGAPAKCSKDKKCLTCRGVFTTTAPTKEWYCGPCREANNSYGGFLDAAGASDFSDV